MAVGKLVMIGVMAMTPVHIKGAGHDAAHTLSIVGLVLSFHIAGMFHRSSAGSRIDTAGGRSFLQRSHCWWPPVPWREPLVTNQRA